eukprot:355617-Chlamydomonas_euryale.AAC.16
MGQRPGKCVAGALALPRGTSKAYAYHMVQHTSTRVNQYGLSNPGDLFPVTIQGQAGQGGVSGTGLLWWHSLCDGALNAA